MFKAMHTNEIFRTCVWTVDLQPEVAGPLNDRLLEHIYGLIAHRKPVPPSSNWQTETYLHRLPEFAPVCDLMRKTAKAILEFLQVQYDGFEITGLWASLSPRGGRHATHTHPNNYLSAVYYVRTPPGGDKITFHDPRPAASVISPPVKRFNLYNGDIVDFTVQPGRLVMFPAWLAHSVPANTNEQERVVLAGDVMLTRLLEDMAPPKWEGTAILSKRPPGG